MTRSIHIVNIGFWHLQNGQGWFQVNISHSSLSKVSNILCIELRF